MMSFDLVLFMDLLFLSLLLFSSGFFHVLKVLLSLEFVVVNVLMLVVYFSSMNYFLYLSLYFMVFSVCEAILGLSLMVLMVRYEGADYVKVVSVTMW